MLKIAHSTYTVSKEIDLTIKQNYLILSIIILIIKFVLLSQNKIE